MKKQADNRTVTHVSQNEKIKSASKDRKMKVRKKEALVSVVVILVLLAGVLAAGTALLKVGSVEVVGNDGRYTDDRIIEIAGVSSNSSILLLNQEKINETVALALPYIQNIEIERSLPDHVQLIVTYAQPAFSVDCGQLWLILSLDGKVLETTQTKPTGLTMLEGVLVNTYTVGKYAEFEDALYFNHAADVFEACIANEINDIRMLKIDPSGYVTMTVEDRFFVQSGSVNVLLKEVAVLKQVMLEREAKKTSFTFTLAADGSITISNRETVTEEETTVPFVDPYLNMDSELVGDEPTQETTSLSDFADLSDMTTAQNTTVADSDTLG